MTDKRTRRKRAKKKVREYRERLLPQIEKYRKQRERHPPKKVNQSMGARGLDGTIRWRGFGTFGPASECKNIELTPEEKAKYEKKARGE